MPRRSASCLSSLLALLCLLALASPTAAASETAAKPRQSRQVLAGFSYVTWVNGAPADARGLPVVVGLHWSHSTPAEFGAYLKNLSMPVRVVLLQGRYRTSPGYSFFPVTPVSYYKMPPDEQHRVLGEEAERLAGFLRAIDVRYPAVTKPVIVGASQGGDLSYAIATGYGERVSMAIPLLGTLDGSPLAAASSTSPSIVALDGDADPIVPAASARAFTGRLRAAGYAVTLRMYPRVGHDISPAMREDLHALLGCALQRRAVPADCNLADADR